MKNYSSGEVAKKPKVSLRTIQYYDTQHIVSPSIRSEKGRRIYTTEDIKKLQLAMLYKALGFALKDIRQIMHSSKPYQVISELLVHYHEQLSVDISKKQTQLDKIEWMQNYIKKESSLDIPDHKTLVMMLNTKKVKTKTNRHLTFYLLFLLISFPICLHFQCPQLAILLSVVGLLWLVASHASHHRYLCCHCQRLFALPWYRDLLTLHDPKKGKYTCCPHCHQRGWMQEVGYQKNKESLLECSFSFRLQFWLVILHLYV